MNSPTSQIPQQCANDCAETVDGSLDGDGRARCFAGTQLGSGGWQGLHLGLANSLKFNERSFFVVSYSKEALPEQNQHTKLQNNQASAKWGKPTRKNMVAVTPGRWSY